MKKLFTVVFLVLYTSLYSQSRQETEAYIINKLKLYSKKSNTHNIQFSFDGNSLNINYIPIDDRYEKQRYVAAVWAIQGISLAKNTNSPNLFIALRKYCESCKKYNSGYKQKYKTEYYTAYEYGWAYGKQTKKEVEKSRRVKDGYSRYNRESLITSINIDFKTADPEEDFLGRFNRAINHLKTLYPQKPKSNDLFGN